MKGTPTNIKAWDYVIPSPYLNPKTLEPKEAKKSDIYPHTKITSNYGNYIIMNTNSTGSGVELILG